ncbi:NAD(P)H-dependent oxidoreductase [Paraferrimonas sp. SM1919]|uniref:NAD(P)H-dependent oxidoreductase n=1 Tax=Paraferrimonas sp. SM1919 TaxID=2662263 RepID=UPI0013CFC10B|nr:NAD(P)H-dependent oxidoreductase [Paraferrimonas sp. SM1919]
MAKINVAFLNASMTGNSAAFAEVLIEKLVNDKESQGHSVEQIIEIDLNDELEGEILNSNNMGDFWSDAQDYIDVLKDSDIIICATSLINYHASPVMVAFLNKIIVNGITFSYNEQGPNALLREEFKNKKVYIVATSGSPKAMLPSGPATAFEAVSQSFEFIGLNTEIILFDGINAPENFGKDEQQLIATYQSTIDAVKF